MNFKRTLVTAALPYANGPKHIGHLAGCYLPADIYVRHLRNKGKDVVFVCGSDEHGAAITMQALKEKTTPREIIDKYHELVKNCFAQLGISFDIYHRTSEPLHHETAQQFFLDLHNRDLLQKEESEQYYDEEAGLFLADRYIIGTCPVCGNENAYGDQCEKCGSSLSPKELKNPRSALSNKAPVLRKTSHYTLPLNKYEGWLKKWILEDHKEWRSNVYGQCKSWIDAGLHPRAVTRDLDWGVKVPLTDAEGKVLYVWFDAPIGYISATKQWAIEKGKNWELYWKDKETRLIHFIGKDNIVFHCIIFPVMLHAQGEYILPDNVPANEFLNLEGDKMSTSRGWSVEMHDFLETFPGKEDVLRYALTSIAPETKDADFTWKDFQLKNNSELVAIFGNFVNRIAVLIQKYFDGKIPAPGQLTEKERTLFSELAGKEEQVYQLIEEFHFREALFEAMNMARAGNKYLAETEPWKVIKTDTEYTATILHTAAQVVAQLAAIFEPFLPVTSEKLKKMFQIEKLVFPANRNTLPAGHALGKVELLFENIDEEIIAQQTAKLKKETKPVVSVPEEKPYVLKPTIEFDDFAKIDLRVGTIIEAQKVKGADKLLQLEIDLGHEKRTILSGIAMHYSPEEVVGKKVSVVANLAPRKMRGIESQGMILMAEDKDGKLRFVESDSNNGSSIS